MSNFFDFKRKRPKKKVHRFKKLRLTFGITQAELANYLNCSQAFVSNVEKRHKKAPKEMLRKFKKLRSELMEEMNGGSK
ncbi:helix-turn-helix transcriptional regulator [Bacteriovoracaceae bacterium]|nr:helix-turn-helix transcriptional regulator [Bacteriovoracaceae bacterium]